MKNQNYICVDIFLTLWICTIALDFILGYTYNYKSIYTFMKNM